MDILRLSTAGSVDDGKSTLIGRLLYDSNALTKEQEELIIRKTKEKGLSDLDFSVITDGLVAEREQGITIDVAHIYFSSKDRKFIIADSPGHVEYTRNMVTGTSNSQVSIILIDARKGLLEQSHRHFFISQLLRLHDVIFCINKMDLVDYNQEVFDDISNQIKEMLDNYDGYRPQIHIVPVSSLKGDNVVHYSLKMAWYQGDTLSDLLHKIIPRTSSYRALRFNVQYVLHVQNKDFKDYRGYCGRVASGSVAVGDTVLALPSAQTAKVTEIRQYKTLLNEAHAGDSVSISLDKDIDLSRGAILADTGQTLDVQRKNLSATIVWLNEAGAKEGDRLIIQAGSRSSQAKLQAIKYLMNPENPQQTSQADRLKLNDIATVEIATAQPLYLDAYSENRANGVFILIHPTTFDTCAVGFVA